MEGVHRPVPVPAASCHGPAAARGAAPPARRGQSRGRSAISCTACPPRAGGREEGREQVSALGYPAWQLRPGSRVAPPHRSRPPDASVLDSAACTVPPGSEVLRRPVPAGAVSGWDRPSEPGGLLRAWVGVVEVRGGPRCVRGWIGVHGGLRVRVGAYSGLRCVRGGVGAYSGLGGGRGAVAAAEPGNRAALSL